MRASHARRSPRKGLRAHAAARPGTRPARSTMPRRYRRCGGVGRRPARARASRIGGECAPQRCREGLEPTLQRREGDLTGQPVEHAPRLRVVQAEEGLRAGRVGARPASPPPRKPRTPRSRMRRRCCRSKRPRPARHVGRLAGQPEEAAPPGRFGRGAPAPPGAGQSDARPRGSPGSAGARARGRCLRRTARQAASRRGFRGRAALSRPAGTPTAARGPGIDIGEAQHRRRPGLAARPRRRRPAGAARRGIRRPARPLPHHGLQARQRR